MRSRTFPIIFAACVMFSGAAASAQTNIASNDLSGFAAGMLNETAAARQAIASRDREAAIQHVRNALATEALIEQNAPNAQRPLLVPVYRSIETTTTVTPVRKNAGLTKYSSVRGVEGDTTTVQLNVTAAAGNLRTAQAALEAGDWSAAETALAPVENGISTTQASGDMPLRMARQNLALAKDRVLEGKYHDAEVPLKSAAEALGQLEQRFTGQQAADIEGARQAMLGYAAHIGHDHADAVGRIDTWMDMLQAWSAQ
jgi:hypothetical protein